MICPKGRDGKCVGGGRNGLTCDSANPHNKVASCFGGRTLEGDCPDCVPVAQSGTPTPRTEAVWAEYAKGAIGDSEIRDEMLKLETDLAACQSARKELRGALDTLVLVVGLTAFKYEGQRQVLQEAVDEARAALAKERL